MKVILCDFCHKIIFNDALIWKIEYSRASDNAFSTPYHLCKDCGKALEAFIWDENKKLKEELHADR